MKQEFDRQAVKVFKALGDPSRYEMVKLLVERGEVSCGELVEHLSLSPPALSHHYRVLEGCGLAEVRRQGVHHFVRLNRQVLERFLPGFLGVHGPDRPRD